MNKKMDDVLEQASDFCHEEWIDWTKSVSTELTEILEQLKINNKYLEENNNDENRVLIDKNTQIINMIETRLERWQSYWVSYDELSDEVKEYDRIYARKILNLVIDK